MEQLFQKIGLNQNESEVYLSVLKAGKIPTHRIAKETGINRTTVYSIAKKLQLFGLISEDVGQKISYLVAESPEKILKMFAKESDLLKEKQEAASELSKELVNLPKNKSYSIPRVKFVEENDLNEYLHTKYVDWKNHLQNYDNTWWGYQDNTFTENYEEFIRWSWKQGPDDLKVKFLTNEAIVEKQLLKSFEGRKTKLLPQNIQFDSSMWIVGDFIVMIQTRTKPHYLIEINDPVFARNQRELFKGLWNLI